jgi:hypothetical protein
MRRTFVAMALTASLVSTAPAGFFDSLWALFSPLWGTKEGCGMDPDGRCLPAPKAGCGMDPNGQCLPAPQPTSDIGCGLDPSGQCKPGS